MRRAIAFVTIGAFTCACGSRTGLFFVPEEAGVTEDSATDGGHGTDAPVNDDAGDAETRPDTTRPPPRTCPLTPPKAGAPCAGEAVQCAYVLPDGPGSGFEGWCCVDMTGWVACTTVAERNEDCADIVCTTGVATECIVGNASSCCTCSSDGTADDCAPCD